MKTKFLNLSSVAIVVVAILSLGLFFSCEEKVEKKDNDVKKWECVLSDGVKITLDMYELENKYFTTVSNTSQMTLLFGDNSWQYYQMDGDTMTIVQINDQAIGLDYNPPMWLISKPSNNVMTMEYFGVLPDDASIKTEYMFNLK